jgi:hypothetical protein
MLYYPDFTVFIWNASLIVEIYLFQLCAKLSRVECYYLRCSVVIVCDAHNTLWCGCNERECEIPDRDGKCFIGIVLDTLQKL